MTMITTIAALTFLSTAHTQNKRCEYLNPDFTYEIIENSGNIRFNDRSVDKDSIRDYIFHWQFGKNEVASGNRPLVNMSARQCSPVILTIEDGQGCSKTITKAVIKNCEELKPEFTWEYLEPAAAIQFIDASEPGGTVVDYSVNWNFENKMDSQEGQPLIEVSTEVKRFFAELTITNKEGCSKTVSKVIFFER